MRISRNCRKYFDKHCVSEAVSLGMAQSWLRRNQIKVIKSQLSVKWGFNWEPSDSNCNV